MGIRTRCPKCAGHGSVWVSLFKGFKKCEYCYGPAGHTMVDFHISPNGEMTKIDKKMDRHDIRDRKNRRVREVF